MSNVIFLSNVRLSFPHIIEPQRREFDGKETISFNSTFLTDPKDPNYEKFVRQVNALASEKWKDKAGKVLEMLLQDQKASCFGDGNKKINQKTFEVLDGYKDMVYVTAISKKRPQVIQNDGTPVDPFDTLALQKVGAQFYAGCRVNVAVKPWIQDNNFGKGIRCDFMAIQFAGDDTPFGNVEKDFSDLFKSANTEEKAAPLPPFMMK